MKRTPLRRTGGLKRSGGLRTRSSLKRSTPVRRANPERLERLKAEQFGEQAALARSLPCLTCRRPPPSVAAHARSRGAGGKARHIVPLCWFCHGEQHAIGVPRFERKYGVDMLVEARKLEQRLEEQA